MRKQSALRLAIFSPALVWLLLPLHGQIAVRKQGYVPFSDAPINYLSDVLSDPVAKLQQRIGRGEVKLEYESAHGYLKSVLAALDIPISSQTLVFLKTSFQFRKISPRTPRAPYFNDDVYVGQVHAGKALEIVSFDPMQGAIFCLLDEQKTEQPVFQRAEFVSGALQYLHRYRRAGLGFVADRGGTQSIDKQLTASRAVRNLIPGVRIGRSNGHSKRDTMLG